jgi:DMSO/TMAO reductase YedYZ molybdopterin-dependent catalytic subunit
MSHIIRRLAVSVLLLVAAAAALSARGTPEPVSPPPDAVPESGYPEYLSLVDGLHVTGTPIEVDVRTYRLHVGGAVATPLELSLDEVRALPSERIAMDLVCPGFFTDSGTWTGVPVAELLRMAGYDQNGTTVEFRSIDGSYAQSLPLYAVFEGEVLVAYQFDDRDFAVYHGFPLRIAVLGQPGAMWVKWLGSITVR